jgi:hypothetical protein
MFYIPPDTINISEICLLLGKVDARAVKEWLHNRNIPLQKNGRDKVANKWKVEMALQSDVIEDLKKCYPNSWRELYKANTSKPELTKATLILHPEQRIKSHINTKRLKTFL